MKYEKSKYNLFVPYKNDETIVFNTLTGAIGKFDKPTMLKYDQDLLGYEEIETLLKKGILIPSGADEKNKVDEDRKSGILRKDSKHMRIWTTSTCNAKCYYCFENGISNTMMTKNTADALIAFIDNMLNQGDELRLEWFGGEPLLNCTVIDYIISKLQPLCEKKECVVYSSMISNGSLINQEMADKIKNEWNISSLQITLDGYGEEYNKIKNYNNSKKYNFFNTIESIKLLVNRNIHVAIRMNYDTSNYLSLVKLIDYLHIEFAHYNDISYYIYPVWSALNGTFHSNTKADENLINLFELLIKYKMNTLRDSARLNARLNYRKHQCRACCINSFTIFPDGKIGKCSEIYNQTIGDVWVGITNKDIFKYWTNTELDLKCKSCIYLPICQGGCRASHFGNMPQCFPNKDIFTDILKWYVGHLESNASS